jgi:Mrp family chromosome partitioning ATPase
MENCGSGDCASARGGRSQADADAAVKGSLGKIKRKLIVMSGKGGVGKTSVSVNLAMALSKKGYKVGIMDVDIHGPDVPRMLGLDGLLGITADQRLVPIKFDENLAAVSIESLSQNKDDAIIWRGPIKHSVIRQFIGEVEWGELDFLIIDAPPGTGDEPLSVAQVINDAKAIIVTTPQEVALADVRKSINFCKTVKMGVLGVVENMSGFTCPHCDQVIELFGSGGGERTAKAFGLAVLGKIPFDPNVVAAGDRGVSFQEVHVDAEAARAFDSVARRVADSL